MLCSTTSLNLAQWVYSSSVLLRKLLKICEFSTHSQVIDNPTFALDCKSLKSEFRFFTSLQ